MSPLVSRILLTILLFPTALLFLFLTFLFLDQLGSGSDLETIGGGTLMTCGYMIVYWLLVWCRDVRWTPARRRSTWLAAGVAAALGGTLGFTILVSVPKDEELAVVSGSLTATLLWIVATVLLWRETPDERGARLARAGADTLVCPSCGYNLTGLREARCPECGAAFTLNDLLASQPGREQVEIERA